MVLKQSQMVKNGPPSWRLSRAYENHKPPEDPTLVVFTLQSDDENEEDQRLYCTVTSLSKVLGNEGEELICGEIVNLEKTYELRYNDKTKTGTIKIIDP